MTDNGGIRVPITAEMRKEFVVDFLTGSEDPEALLRKRDIRSAFVRYLHERQGRYRKDIDNSEAGLLYASIQEILGPLEESVNTDGHSVYVGLVQFFYPERAITTRHRLARAFGNNLKLSYLEGYDDGFSRKPYNPSGAPSKGEELFAAAYAQGWNDGKDDARD